MTGLTDQEQNEIAAALYKGIERTAWDKDVHPILTTVAQIKARAVAETAERIAVALEAESERSVRGESYYEDAARIARAEAGR